MKGDTQTQDWRDSKDLDLRIYPECKSHLGRIMSMNTAEMCVRKAIRMLKRVWRKTKAAAGLRESSLGWQGGSRDGDGEALVTFLSTQQVL